MSNSPIVITGFMGCGKSEVARCLADHLGRELIDLDELVTQREGKSPAQLIAQDGEPYFRNREAEALEDCLKNHRDAVIALGGGAWIESRNRTSINSSGGISIWLNVSFEVCWERILSSSEDRPLGKTRDQAQRLFDLRLPIYQEAQMHFDLKPSETPQEFASRIAVSFKANTRK